MTAGAARVQHHVTFNVDQFPFRHCNRRHLFSKPHQLLLLQLPCLLVTQLQLVRTFNGSHRLLINRKYPYIFAFHPHVVYEVFIIWRILPNGS